MGIVRTRGSRDWPDQHSEYVGKGTMVDLGGGDPRAAGRGQPLRYAMCSSSRRAPLDFEGPDTPRTIRVVKGKRAWNESWYDEKTKTRRDKNLKTENGRRSRDAAGADGLAPAARLLHARSLCRRQEVPRERQGLHDCPQGRAGGRQDRACSRHQRPALTRRSWMPRSAGSHRDDGGLPSGTKKMVAIYTGWRTGAADTDNRKDLTARAMRARQVPQRRLSGPKRSSYEIDGTKVLDITVIGRLGQSVHRLSGPGTDRAGQ